MMPGLVGLPTPEPVVFSCDAATPEAREEDASAPPFALLDSAFDFTATAGKMLLAELLLPCVEGALPLLTANPFFPSVLWEAVVEMSEELAAPANKVTGICPAAVLLPEPASGWPLEVEAAPTAPEKSPAADVPAAPGAPVAACNA